MFKLKRPCENCPFRKGVGEAFQLRAERLGEIKRAVAFQCHATVDYESGEEDENGFPIPEAGNKPQQCAGLMSILHREGYPNHIMQLGERLKWFDPSKLDPDREAYDTWEDVLAAHIAGGKPNGRGRRKQGRARE